MALTEQQGNYVMEHYQTMHYQQLADALGVKRHDVVYHLKKNGLVGTKKVLALSESQQQELKRDYKLRNKHEWAEYLGIPVNSLGHYVRALGLNGTKNRKSTSFDFTGEHDAFIQDSYLHWTQAEMAKKIGCTLNHLKRRMGFLGLKFYTHWTTENEQFLKMHWTFNSDEELASMTGRTVQAIYGKRTQLGLKRSGDNFAVRKEKPTEGRRPRKSIARRKWTQDEILFLQKNASRMSDDEIAEVLSRTYRSIKHKRLQLGIERLHTRSAYELEIENILSSFGKEFVEQYPMGRYRYDFKVGNTLIEFNGDYFHCNPDVYPNGPINNLQHYQILKDKQKQLLALSKGYDFLVIWEKDFVFNKEEVLSSLRAVQ